MVKVTILSKAECPLCEEAAAVVRRVQPEVPFTFEMRDITGDPHLTARYQDRIPVMLIDGVERLEGRLTEDHVRRAIRRAHRSGPISRILSRFRLGRNRG